LVTRRGAVELRHVTAPVSRDALTTRLLRTAMCATAAVAILLATAIPAEADGRATAAQASQSRQGKTPRAHRQMTKSQRRRLRKQVQRRRRALRARARRANRRVEVSSNAAVSASKAKTGSSGSAPGVLDAGFEDGLLNWNTAGVGDSIPTVVSDTVRNGASSCKVALNDDQDRSELILGGNGGGSTSGMIEFHEGDEYWYGFSFNILSMVYGEPGAHNLIMQFKGNDDGSPNFGLALWDYEGDDGEYEDNPKGLWSHGSSMDGDRFLAPVSEHAWHDIVIHFKASGSGDGFYELFLDGQPIDSRSGVSMIAPGASYAYIKNGIYRNGGEIPGTSEIRLDAARLGQNPSDVAVG
jgi:hypothetical protein